MRRWLILRQPRRLDSYEAIPDGRMAGMDREKAPDMKRDWIR